VYTRLDKETLENRLTEVKAHVLQGSMEMIKKGLKDHQSVIEEETANGTRTISM
jgi:hypothetical protein